MSQTIEVALMGRSFSIRTDDEPEHVHAAANLVQERIDELRKMGGAVASDRLLTLVALNLAGELLMKESEQTADTDTLISALDDIVLQAKGLAEAPLR